MMKHDLYKANLKATENWIDYLNDNSNLPGKRANLELMKVVVELGDEILFKECMKLANGYYVLCQRLLAVILFSHIDELFSVLNY